MSIRPATREDVPALAALGLLMHAESDYRTEPYREHKVRALLQGLIDGAGVVFVAERAGEVVGGIAGGVAPNWFNDELVGFEYGLFIRPDARGAVGRSVLLLAMAFSNWCRDRGARRLRVGITTGVHVESTSRLYESLGFEPAGVFFQKEFTNVHRG